MFHFHLSQHPGLSGCDSGFPPKNAELKTPFVLKGYSHPSSASTHFTLLLFIFLSHSCGISVADRPLCRLIKRHSWRVAVNDGDVSCRNVNWRFTSPVWVAEAAEQQIQPSLKWTAFPLCNSQTCYRCYRPSQTFKLLRAQFISQYRASARLLWQQVRLLDRYLASPVCHFKLWTQRQKSSRVKSV